MRTARTRDDSVIRVLRAMAPTRRLSPAEARRLAEKQADRLLALFGVVEPPVPASVITDLPRICVEERQGLPVAALAFWDGSCWVITLNASDSTARKRFSLMHEFKHVLDHPLRQTLYGTEEVTAEARERIADHFAACVLMPRRWVKGAFAEKVSSADRLAGYFAVSRHAMRYRLSHLRLVPPHSTPEYGTFRHGRGPDSSWPTTQQPHKRGVMR